MDNQQVSTLTPIPTKDGYFCDDNGQVYSTVRTGELVKLSMYEHFGRSKKQPYLRVRIRDNHFLVHRLVLSAKIGRWLN